MKILTAVLCFAICSLATIQAKKISITVKKPGTLKNLVGINYKNQITALTLSGKLNSTDLRFLREMAGSDVRMKPTEGKLKKIDLSKVSFVSGGEHYIEKDERCYTQGAYTIPKFLFRHCLIQEVILPQRTDTIETGAFEHTQIKRIKLPENIVVLSWAFNNAVQLEEVHFPQNTKIIAPYVFSKCDKLKCISLHNVGYIGANSMIDMSALEKIEIKGFVGHIDGWNTIANCPELKQVDFYGAVLSTGGPKLVSNCKKLQKITFHGPIFNINIGEAADCPLFKEYVIKNLVFKSGEPLFIPETTQEQLKSDSRYQRCVESFLKITEELYKQNLATYVYSFSLTSYLFYNEACRYAGQGKKTEALKFLKGAINAGFSGYSEMKEDQELNSIRGEKEYADLLDRVRLAGDYVYMLKQSEPYKRIDQLATRFTYSLPTDSNLVCVRNYFNLDSIAGQGNEITRIKNLLYWLHKEIRHDGSSPWPQCKFNAIELYKLAKKENRGLNCRFMAIMLNEIYLSMGFKSRFITCMSKAYTTDSDCHVINIVWSESLNKWIWMDPTFAAYVTDENGLLLHPGEVRKRLIENQPLILNEDANWNHKTKQTKKGYLEEYMAKNLYLISAHLVSEFETEAKEQPSKSIDITLVPSGFVYKWGQSTSDDAYFWQAPNPEK